MVFWDRHPFFGASGGAILTPSWQQAPRQQKLKPCSWDAHRTTCAPGRDQRGIGAKIKTLHTYSEFAEPPQPSPQSPRGFQKGPSFWLLSKSHSRRTSFPEEEGWKTICEVSAKDISMTVGILFYFSSFGIQWHKFPWFIIYMPFVFHALR